MENLIKMDDLGVPLFFGNTHMIVFCYLNLRDFRSFRFLMSLQHQNSKNQMLLVIFFPVKQRFFFTAPTWYSALAVKPL